jgi:hypothetical protein
MNDAMSQASQRRLAVARSSTIRRRSATSSSVWSRQGWSGTAGPTPYGWKPLPLTPAAA